MNESKYHISTPMGIHRLKKEPFDDKEIFTDLSYLLYYCKYGARYDGQKISYVFKQNNNTYIQNFIINNNYPILQIPNIEQKIIKDDNTNDYYILIYHHNPIDFEELSSSDLKPLYNITNPNLFSIIGLLDIFRSDLDYIYNSGEINHTTLINRAIETPIKFKVDIKYKEYTLGNLLSLDIEQNIHPLYPRVSNYSPSNNELYYIPTLNKFILNVTSNSAIPATKYDICPIQQTNHIIDIYIKATDYIKSMGVL